MRWSDLLRMSAGSLKRRKLRAFLTILGVVIGTTSIVVMISLGLGLQQSMYEQVERDGGTNTLTVTGMDNYFYDSGSEEDVPDQYVTDDAVEMLMDFIDDIMYKDAFSLAQIRNPTSLRNLVFVLAQSVGQEVSYDSLARETRLSSPTIERYLDILEKCFIIRRVPSFSRNLANELRKGKKIYFCDVGIRNAVLDDFTPFTARSDAGALWENFFFMERLKKHDLERTFTRQFFWRVRGTRRVAGTEKAVEYSREIDFVEAKDNRLEAFECKLNPKKKDSGGQEFRDAYPDCSIHVVSPQNCRPYFQLQ